MWDKIAQSIDSEIDKSGIRSLFYDFENIEGEGCSDTNFQIIISQRADVLRLLDQLDLRGYTDFFIEILSGHMADAFFAYQPISCGQPKDTAGYPYII